MQRATLATEVRCGGVSLFRQPPGLEDCHQLSVKNGLERDEELISDAGRLEQIFVTNDLLQHEVGYVSARNFRWEKPVADVVTNAVLTCMRTVRQCSGTDNHPVKPAFPDDAFLNFLIGEDIAEKKGDHKKVVNET